MTPQIFSVTVNSTEDWVSSYEMSGYTAPPEGEGRDYLKKWHECIKSYSDLPEKIKHYDWIPVKIAFAMKK